MIILTESNIKRVLFGATVLLGNEGQNWVKKIAKDGKITADGAISQAARKLKFSSEEAFVAYRYISNIVTEFGYPVASLTMYNDDPKTVFSNIKDVFDIGISRLKVRQNAGL